MAMAGTVLPTSSPRLVLLEPSVYIVHVSISQVLGFVAARVQTPFDATTTANLDSFR